MKRIIKKEGQDQGIGSMVVRQKIPESLLQMEVEDQERVPTSVQKEVPTSVQEGPPHRVTQKQGVAQKIPSGTSLQKEATHLRQLQ